MQTGRNAASDNALLQLGPGTATSTMEASRIDLHEHSKEQHSNIPRPILGLFIALISWLLWLLGRATNVHSRFGLAFTGVVELTCSSVMSYSVLTLLEAGGIAWRSDTNSSTEPRVPWYILPFVILVVGVENMSALVSSFGRLDSMIYDLLTCFRVLHFRHAQCIRSRSPLLYPIA